MTDITQLKDCMFAELGLEIKYMTCTLYSVYAPPQKLWIRHCVQTTRIFQ